MSARSKAASILGKIGGSQSSKAKSEANRRSALKRWKEIKQGLRPRPKVGRKPNKHPRCYKTKYSSEAEARSEAKLMRRPFMVPVHCPNCKAWHLKKRSYAQASS